ncbi:unnamed protein product [Clonostachys solani]|uniref:Uncharacterized protein n=1 Tax=Clonostachys solani TaxID=160281 RepID=A0A9P0EQU2_9HYPO|nr:unnamed protein product [Clonostachys solani]
MAPSHSTRWMQTHRQALGKTPLRDICLPSSHDSGTYRLEFGTTGGGKGTVLTQTKTIFEQLELGVRRFDIRPTLANNPAQGSNPKFSWNCGHYTPEGADKVGWQGGSCAPIDEVVGHINRFTENNAELIIVDITHVMSLLITDLLVISPAHSLPTPSESWDVLFYILKGINCLFPMSRVGGDNGKPLQDYTLDTFIGDGKAAVVVIIEGDKYRESLIGHGFWPQTTPKGEPSLAVKEMPVTRMQGTFEAITSLVLPGTAVLNLAAKRQEERFPWLLQDIARDRLEVSAILMDKIENADLLTFCLAVTLCRKRSGDEIIIVYGGSLVPSSSSAYASVRSAIDQRNGITASNSLFSDTWHGLPKSCAVFYRQDDIIKGRWAREGASLRFDVDIVSAHYGGKDILDRRMYYKLLRALCADESITVNNQSMVGTDKRDPKPGVEKECIIKYRAGSQTETKPFKEYTSIQFSRRYVQLMFKTSYTNKERGQVLSADEIEGWFAPVSGDLQLGGRYQAQGKAGGTIEEYNPLESYRLGWESRSGPVPSRLKLTHLVPASDHWDTFGAGAAGVGWDTAYLHKITFGDDWFNEQPGKDFLKACSQSTTFYVPSSSKMG